MHLSSHLTVKLQQRTIYSIYTDVGHAVGSLTPWARPVILLVSILVLNILLQQIWIKLSRRDWWKKRKKSIVSISTSAESVPLRQDDPGSESHTLVVISVGQTVTPVVSTAMLSNRTHSSNLAPSSSPAPLHIYSVSPTFSSTRSSGNQVSNFLFTVLAASSCLDQDTLVSMSDAKGASL